MKNLLFIICLLLIQSLSKANMITVSILGSGEFTSIQAGINVTAEGDTVLVMPGEYIETIDFLGKNIVVASNYLFTKDTSDINQTIINGNHQYSRLVRFTNGETREARLIGFTIKNGYDETIGANPEVVGIGIYINNSSPTIEHNKVKNNEFGELYNCGAGIAIKKSSAVIRSNEITGNDYAFWGGGIYIDSSVNVVIEKNYLANHFLTSGYGVAEGGGIFIYRSNNIIIENNLIEENYLDFGDGAAITAWSSSNLVLINNKICNNRSSNYYSELCIQSGSQIKMIGNLMYNSKYFNKRVRIKVEGSQLDVINSTIIGNNYSAITSSNSTLIVFNSILHNPSDTTAGNQIRLTNSVLYATNCNIESDTSGVVIIPPSQQNDTSRCVFSEIISSNPLFANQNNDNYNLLYNSPCIDKGSMDTIGFNLPAFDLAGEPRIENFIIDMGAYEYPYYLSLHKPIRNLVFSIIPNPAKNSFSILTDDYVKGEFSYCIFNSHGQVVMKGNIQTGTQIPIGNLKPGIYIIEITQDHEKGIQRLVKL